MMKDCIEILSDSFIKKRLFGLLINHATQVSLEIKFISLAIDKALNRKNKITDCTNYVYLDFLLPK